MEDLAVQRATLSDLALVSTILGEAASWLAEQGMPLWDADSLSGARLKPEVEKGGFWLFFKNGKPVGVLNFQLEDRIYWPDSLEGEAAYVHKLVVRRKFSGQGLSTKMLRWAAERCAELGRPFLRLDCQASRAPLCRIYEGFGFERGDDVEVLGRTMARFQLAVVT